MQKTELNYNKQYKTGKKRKKMVLNHTKLVKKRKKIVLIKPYKTGEKKEENGINQTIQN